MPTKLSIEIVREYILSNDESKKKQILSGISSNLFSETLIEIERLFNLQSVDMKSLAILASSIESNESMQDLLAIQRDYYALQSDLYISGETNFGIEALLTVKNQDFLREIEFQENLRHVVIMDERVELKNKFIDWKVGAEKRKEELKSNINPINKRKAPVIRLIYKQIAIAAILLGIILTTFVLVRPIKKPDIVLKYDNIIPRDSQLMKSVIAQRDLLQMQLKNLITSSTDPIEVKQIPVLKDKSLGFALKQENVMVRIYELAVTPTSLNMILSVTSDSNGLRRTQDTVLRYDPISNKLISQIDSIQNRVNKFKFIDDTLSLFVKSNNAIKSLHVLQIVPIYYLKINDRFYYCQPTSKELTLTEITEVVVLRKLERILSLNSK